jgi:hypothetical protein
LVATAGTGATFYGNALAYGTRCVVSGSVMGFSRATTYGLGCVVSATIIACSAGIQYGSTFLVTSTIMGCIYGINGTQAITANGAILGCDAGLNACLGGRVNGAVSRCGIGLNNGDRVVVSATGSVTGCLSGFTKPIDVVVEGGVGYTAAGVYSPNTTDFSFSTYSDGTATRLVLRGAKMDSTPTTASRNTTSVGSATKQGVFSEDHGRALGASYAFLPTGDVIRNAVTVRSGGAATSLEVVPLSNCSSYLPILVCEWTEVAVPASAQNKSVYVKGEGWSSYPLASELYLEAEYISHGTTFARTTVASTAVLTDNTTWVQLATGSFTPAVAGHVRYRVWLKKFAVSTKVFVDNALYSA